MRGKIATLFLGGVVAVVAAIGAFAARSQTAPSVAAVT
jgi:hypothetical protein